MSNWVLLIPPSESKADPPGNGMIYENARKTKKTNSFKELDRFRNMVMETLQDAVGRGSGLERLFDALDKDSFGVGCDLKRVTAPDYDVGSFAWFKGPCLVGHTPKFGWGFCNCLEGIIPVQAMGHGVPGIVSQQPDVVGACRT